MGTRLVEVSVTGGEMAVTVHGDEAPSAVFLAIHDTVGNGRIWDGVAHRLGPGVALIAPDLRGRGASAGLDGPVTLERMVDDLDVLLDHFGMEEVAVIGAGSGAVVAERLRHAAPGIVALTVGLIRADDRRVGPSGRADETDLLGRRAAGRADWIRNWRAESIIGGRRLTLGAESFFGRGLVRRGSQIVWRDDLDAVRDVERWPESQSEPSDHDRAVVVGGDAHFTVAGVVAVTDHSLLSLLLTADGSDVVARVLRSLLAR